MNLGLLALQGLRALRRPLGLLALLGLTGALAGCAQMVPQTIGLRSGWPAEVPRQLELDAVPFFAQSDYQCGPAALATVLHASGAQADPDALVRQVYLPSRQGSLQVEMLAAPRLHGRVAWQLPPHYDALLRELAAGRPVLVLQDVGLPPFANWHYAVVVGFNYEAGELYLRSGTTRREVVPFTIFELTWRRSGYWAMVVNKPGTLPATATEASYLPALLAFERSAQPEESRRAWAAFAQRWPGNRLASLALANRHYEAHDLLQAEAVLQVALLKHPDSPELINNLAQVVSDQGRHAEALALIDRAAVGEGPFAADIATTRAGIVQRRDAPR